MYEELRQLLDHAHACEMVTTVTTNGTLLDARRLDVLRGGADLVAISLDGVPESHNEIRASPRAFDRMRSHLDAVRETGIPFGFIFTLTQYNVNELQWVADFAVREGAKLLQVHPLDDVGRARVKMPGAGPDELESACAFVEVARLQEELGEQIVVHVDLIDRDFLREHPERVFADEAEETSALPFSEVVSPLVIEADGTVVPIQHGFAREFALGSLHAAPLREMMASWRAERLTPFRELCRRVYSETTRPTELPFFNWYETLGRTAAGA
jgi:MoaA/NifB/PqqE/SkfB family radical SAM enzyme